MKSCRRSKILDGHYIGAGASIDKIKNYIGDVSNEHFWVAVVATLHEPNPENIYPNLRVHLMILGVGADGELDWSFPV